VSVTAPGSILWIRSSYPTSASDSGVFGVAANIKHGFRLESNATVSATSDGGSGYNVLIEKGTVSAVDDSITSPVMVAAGATLVLKYTTTDESTLQKFPGATAQAGNLTVKGTLELAGQPYSTHTINIAKAHFETGSKFQIKQELVLVPANLIMLPATNLVIAGTLKYQTTGSFWGFIAQAGTTGAASVLSDAAGTVSISGPTPRLLSNATITNVGTEAWGVNCDIKDSNGAFDATKNHGFTLVTGASLTVAPTTTANSYQVDTRGSVLFDADSLQSIHRVISGTLTLGPTVTLAVTPLTTKVIGGPTTSGTLMHSGIATTVAANATIHANGEVNTATTNPLAPNVGTDLTDDQKKPYKWSIDAEWVQ
jgi:hypothetical protein